LSPQQCGNGSAAEIEVLDDVVRIEIDLPWIMQLLAIRSQNRYAGAASR